MEIGDSEQPQNPTTPQEELRELQKRQNSAGVWTENDRIRLLELTNQLTPPEGKITQAHKDALHKQGTEATLTSEDRRLVQEVNGLAEPQKG